MKVLATCLFSIVVWLSPAVEALQSPPAVSAHLFRLANEQLEIAIELGTGNLVQLLDRKTGRNHVTPGAASPGFWHIETSGAAAPISPAQATHFTVERSPGNARAARLQWTGFEAAPGLRVTVLVEVADQEPVSRWRIAVEGMPRERLTKVHFPRIQNLPQQPQERLAVPAWLGQLSLEPRQLLFDSANRPRRMEWAYPGELSLQCVAWYAEGGSGLYIAAEDVAAYRKTAAVFGTAEGGVGLEWVHLPEVASGDSWELPFPAVIGVFQGDWITAAERYRDWGTRQAWAQGSRLKRGLVPKWVEQTGLWVWNRGGSTNVLDPAIALQRNLDLPVSVFWHWWHGCAYDSGFPEYLPPREGADAFRSAVADARKRDIRALVYMNQRLWGMTTASWTNQQAERWAVKAQDGKIRPEVYNTFTKAPCVSMCLGTEFWRNTYATLAEEAILDLGVSGIYMDQACLSLACYDPSHGHPVGGGTYWVNGFQRLAQDIRQRSGSKRPALAGEGCGEPWLPHLDLMLSLQVSRERYAAPDGWETIPFFQAVYHPYAITFGNYSSLTMPPYDEWWPAEFAPKEPLKLLDRKFSRQFLMEQARAFVWGQQPTVANFLPEHLDTRREELEFVMRLARLRRKATAYLQDGTYVRPPDLSVPVVKTDMSRLSIYAGQQGGLTVFQKELPLVVAGAWRAPDGSIGIALASVADQQVDLVVPVNTQDWKLRKHVRVTRIDSTKAQRPFRLPADGQIRLRFRPQEACVLVLR